MATGSVAVQRIAPRVSRGLWGDALRRLLRNRPAIFGMVIIVVFLVTALFAPYLAPYNPNVSYPPPPGEPSSRLGPYPPSLIHPFGQDKQGRDEFSRVIYGARVSLVAGLTSVIVGVALGGLVGAVAGAASGRTDNVLMRIVDVMLAIPGILLAIGIVSFMGQGLVQITIAVALTNAPIFARLLRGGLLSVRESDYVIASRAVGASRSRLLMRHMLPNSLTPIIVAATLALATAIIDIAGLGFLGLGPADPRIPEWGTMMTDAREFLRVAPYLLFYPGMAIVLTAVGFNLLGDGLRESLDPRLRR
jgi:peptide/nickel transport system permease protein